MTPEEVIRIRLETQLDTAGVNMTERQFGQSMDNIAGSAGKAEKAVTQASQRMDVGMRRAGEAGRAAGDGIVDFAKKVANGGAPLEALTDQAFNMAGALAGGGAGAAAGAGGIAGAATSVMELFGGPWGIALLAGGFALTQLMDKQKDEGATLDDTYDKLVKSKAQTELNREADERWSHTIGGLTEAIAKQNGELRKRLQTQGDVERASIAEAEKNAASARNGIAVGQQHIREQERALAEATARYRAASSGKTGGTLASQQAAALIAKREMDAASDRLNVLRGAVSILSVESMWADQNVAMSKAAQSTREVLNSMDPLAAAQDKYTQSIKDATDAYTLHNITLEKKNQLVREAKTALTAAEDAAKASHKKPGGPLTDFINPLTGGGTVTGKFGEMRSYPRPHVHAGIDLATPVGTPVKAAAGGIIVESGTIPGYGNVIAIDHGGGTITRYAHLSQLGIAKGKVVEQGQVVGLSGGARGAPGSGDSTGPHLHYEVRQGGKPVDPRTGRYATDDFATGSRGAQLAATAEAKRAAEAAAAKAKSDAQTARYDSEMAALDQQMVAASTTRATTMAEALEQELGAVDAAGKRKNEEYTAAALAHRITEKQAEELIGRNNQVTNARKDQVNADEARRVADLNRATDLELANEKVAELSYQASLAKGSKERLAADTALMNAQKDVERAELQRVIDTTEIGSKEHELAVLKQAEVERARGRAAADIARADAGPLDQYRDQLHQTAAQIDDSMENIAVDGLKSLNDGIADAIMGTKSLGEVFDSVAKQIISALIRIAVQQLIIKPLMDMIGGAFGGGGSSSGGGSILSSTIASFFGKAGGGAVSKGQPYMVGESGKELFVPGAAGSIIPNSALASMEKRGGGSTAPSISLTIHAPGATAETVAMIRRELMAAAPALVAASQRATINQLTRTRT